MNLKTNILLLIWERIKKDPFIWFLLIVCLYIVSAYYFNNIRIPTSFSIEIVEGINSIAFNLSLSYISGMILYILSVFLPNVRKTNAVLRNLLEDLRLFKDCYYEFLSLCGIHEFNDDKAAENLFQNISKSEYDVSNMHHTITLNATFVSKSKETMMEFDSYLNSIMARHDFLTSNEFDQLTEIRNSPSFSQIRHHFSYNSPTLYSSDNLIEFCGNFVEMHRRLVKLYEDMLSDYISDKK